MLPKCLVEDNYLKMLIHKGNNQNVSQNEQPNKRDRRPGQPLLYTGICRLSATCVSTWNTVT